MTKTNATYRPLLTIPQVCERLTVSHTTVRLLIRTAKLRALKVAGVWRVDEDDLEAYIEAQKAAAHGPSVEAAIRRVFDADLELPKVPNEFL